MARVGVAVLAWLALSAAALAHTSVVKLVSFENPQNGLGDFTYTWTSGATINSVTRVGRLRGHHSFPREHYSMSSERQRRYGPGNTDKTPEPGGHFASASTAASTGFALASIAGGDSVPPAPMVCNLV